MKRWMTILLALSLLIVSSSAIAESAYDYGTHTDYPLRSVWDQEAFPGATIASFLSGNDSFDVEAFLNSSLGETTIQRQFDSFIMYQDDMDAELVKKWSDAGVIKELHDADDPAHKWASYVPTYMLDESNADKTYPVVFVLHGNGNTIMQAESWGYAHICADEGFIAIIPDMNNMDDWETEIPRIFESIKVKYPIDTGRVYVSGFSKGGRTTLLAAMTFPDIFTACAPGGMVLTAYGSKLFGNLDKGLPMLHIGGMVDMIPIFPIAAEANADPAVVEDPSVTPQEFVASWLKVNGVTTAVKEPGDTATDAEKAVGLIGDASYTEERDGSRYYFVDYNNDGATVVRFVAVEGMPHWPSPSQGKIAWDFMSRFARDENGEIIIVGE